MDKRMGTHMVMHSSGLIDLGSRRAHKARLRLLLTTPIRIVIGLIFFVFLLGGGMLVALGVSIGWVLLGLAALPAMVLEWYNSDLKELVPTSQAGPDLSSRLDSVVLGRLRVDSSLKDVVEIAAKTQSALFVAARYGVTPQVLSDIADDPNLTLEAVLAKAEELRGEANELSGAMIGCATVLLSQHRDVLLAHLHLDEVQLATGIEWYRHLQNLIRHHGGPKRTGGIARDWAFGYTPQLNRFARNVSREVERGGGRLNVEIASHQAVIEQLIDVFGSGGAQNVALVGPTGVGKTMLVESFAERLLDASGKVPAHLKFRQILLLDAATMISAAPGRGEIEQLTMQLLSEAYAAKNIIVCLDNAELFFEDGVGSVDIGNVLLPILEAGNLRMILTMDEQRLLRLSQRNPNILNALNRINIAPATEVETIEVMQDQLIVMEVRHKVTYTYQSLAEVYRLSSRYVHDIAMPGQALKLLDSAAKYHESGLVTINSVQQAIEQTLNIKVSVASESEDREKLLNLEDLIHERMINQTRAVSVVSDALRRARAGVRNENRPIGTFLFLGPTGVGKTELAKALADAYFGGEKQMIRLDLNEFVREEDVARLIADGADDPTSLTAQVMKQPYSVILLDEIEKAHTGVLTTLLQLLDEGILRDIKNREVSFRDTIVIATSNAGADRIREYIQRGYQLEQFEQQFMNELIESNQFRPEFLNRFDEVVTFTPLSKADLLRVVDLMIAGVNKTLALQKISVTVDDEARQLLVDRGYDPRLGARPMRRVIQKAVENTVARAVLAGQAQPGSIIQISVTQVQATLGAGTADTNVSTLSDPSV